MTRIVAICLAACICSIAVLGIAIHQTPNRPDNWSRFRDALESSKTRGDMIVGQLERFRAERGRYPDRLDELMPGYLSEMPRPTDGEGFFYETRDGRFTLIFGFWYIKDVDLYPHCRYERLSGNDFL